LLFDFVANTMSMSTTIYSGLQVEDGLCSLKSIVGDEFVAVPKGFQQELLETCVFRQAHMNTVVEKLQASMKDSNSPGVYIQGPMGAGKSLITYMVAQYAKFQLDWLTIYIPNCVRWTNCDGPVAAKGFFIDRVSEALSNCNQSVADKCKGLCDLVNDAKSDKSLTWEDFVDTPEDRALVETTYRKVRAFLNNCTHVEVLLIFDEVNALWSSSTTYFDSVPWNMTTFKDSRLKNGAMLISGTTDAEFIGQIPSGVDQKALYQVGELEDKEVETMMLTHLCAPLKRVRDFDATCYDAIITASGKIPRELGQFAACLDKMSKQILDELEEPAKKKLKLDIDAAIAVQTINQYAAHLTALNYELKKDEKQGVTVFTSSLFRWCTAYFLEGKNTGADQEILRVPNFIVCQATMRPTVPVASAVYFKWFVQECRKRKFIEEHACTQLGILASAATGGEREISFERLLAANVMLVGSRTLALSYRRFDEDVTTTHTVPIKVCDRVCASASCPPKSCFDFAEGTLLSHTDPNGGEARIDMVFYSEARVIFIEATVGDYRSTKLPPVDDSQEKREEMILRALNKWIGSELVVEVNRTQRPPTLGTRYRTLRTSRSTVDRPNPPSVEYIIATTCPNTIRPNSARVDGLAWMKVCFLEDLISSGLIPEDKKAEILENQAQTAGRTAVR
jgi:hypothetical protein